MAAINPSQEATFKSTNDLKITILQSDILDLKADVFVTGEFPNLSPPSELCQSFCRGTRIRTEEWIKDIKLLYSRLEHKTVISKITKYPNPIVFHVIFDPFQLATRDLEGLYLDVLNKAEKLQCRSLAMPLLDKSKYILYYFVFELFKSQFCCFCITRWLFECRIVSCSSVVESLLLVQWLLNQSCMVQPLIKLFLTPTSAP